MWAWAPEHSRREIRDATRDVLNAEKRVEYFRNTIGNRPAHLTSQLDYMHALSERLRKMLDENGE